MKVLIATRISLLAFILAATITFWKLAIGLAVTGVQIRRLGWIVENSVTWSLGWWLWMAAIFCWMWLLVSLSWGYLPAHRVQGMLQSGLMIIAATLAILGVIVWSSLLPIIATRSGVADWLDWVDGLALALLGSALFMAGIVTAWIGYDLWRQEYFPSKWCVLHIAAGLLLVPSPFLFPFYWHLAVSLLFWLAWCAYLATRPQMPHAFPEWK